MFNFIANTFGYMMNFIYDIVQNYGLAIIIFTVLVKLILLPLTLKSQKSMEKVQELQPLYQELQRKYAGDQQKLAEEYQKLLKEKNLNMFSGMGCSGCLIQLLQLPIILGLFFMMCNPLTYILKIPEEELNNYKTELNTYYAEQALANVSSGEEITLEQREEILNKDYVSNYRYNELVIAKNNNLFNMNFLGINLGDIASENRTSVALYILPVLCMVSTFVSLKFASGQAKKKTQGIEVNNEEKNLVKKDDEIPMPNMGAMNTMMPIMTGYIAFIAPQGLALYWTTNSILQLIQSTMLGKKKNKSKTDNIIK